MEGSPKLVAAVSAEEKPYTRIKFDRSKRERREPQSGSEDRYKSNRFSRSPSPYTPRYSRDNRERPIQTNNNRFGDDWRNRSQSNSRSQSLERRPQRFQNNRLRSAERRPFYNNNRQSNLNRPFSPIFNSTNRNPQEKRINPGFNNLGINQPFVRSNTNSSRPVCYYCQKPGHQAKQCRLKMKNQRLGDRRFSQN